MLITEERFQAQLECETKAFLKASGEVGEQHDIVSWQRCLFEDFQQRCQAMLRSSAQEDEILLSASLPQDLACTHRLVIGCTAHTPKVHSHLHALERSLPFDKKYVPYIPIRFVAREKITKHDRLLLAFDALVLAEAYGKLPPTSGKIIHGNHLKITKVKVAALIAVVRSIMEKIAAQQAANAPPQLILNKHCAECEFQTRCRQRAIEADELSLLARMTEKERETQHSKGIVTVIQLSYTYRPRRKPKRFAAKLDKYAHALKALAIRENKIHVSGKPQLNIHRDPVYLDVEGVPDQDFYYLVGLRFKSSDSYVQHAFWANDPSEERGMWVSLLKALAEIGNPQLIHYGSYEKVFLSRMRERYGDALGDSAFLEQLLTEAVDILGLMYAQIYFPTYSNGLKEIVQSLGFRWTDSNATGLTSLMWRSQWELSKDPGLKQKLIRYNAEDCEALEVVTGVVSQLCQTLTEPSKSTDRSLVHTDSLKHEAANLYNFGKSEFLVPEFEFINRCAYWDYQREKVYVRTSPRLKQVARKNIKRRAKTFPVNKIVFYKPPQPSFCPKCKSTQFVKNGRRSKLVYDLKFGQGSIKRWSVRYIFHRYRCHQCQSGWCFQQPPWSRGNHGPNLRAYSIYQIIALRIPQRTVTLNINQSFGFSLSSSAVHRHKSQAADLYKDTYEAILHKLTTGKLIHADETRITLSGQSGYVWVLTSLEEVAYFYTKTRGGDKLRELLSHYKGVLVSDFYAVYDGVDCPQQKCLIHLIRDLNDDLLKEPFNEELKGLVREFGALLRPMIETVDRFGLKARFLRKHKVFVKRFYGRLSTCDYRSELATKNIKRFEKNRDKLFTFLGYDGVPWNNNNAEHAVKAFATLRKAIGGTSSANGIREYLILLSISETCKYKGGNFLNFLRSGDKDVDGFLRSGAKRGTRVAV